jgi:hypothetical protein
MGRYGAGNNSEFKDAAPWGAARNESALGALAFCLGGSRGLSDMMRVRRLKDASRWPVADLSFGQSASISTRFVWRKDGVAARPGRANFAEGSQHAAG